MLGLNASRCQGLLCHKIEFVGDVNNLYLFQKERFQIKTILFNVLFLQLSISTSTTIIMPVRYNDLYFRIIAALLAAHCIVAFGDKETLFQLLLDKYYYMALGSSFVIALVLVTIVNFITRKLDRHFDWKVYPVERTGLQLLAGLVLPAVVALLLAGLYFKLNGLDIFKTLYFQIDFPVIVGMILLFNIYYLTYYFYLQMRLAEKAAQVSNKAENILSNQTEFKEVIIASRGAKNIPIPVNKISYIYHQDEYNFIKTSEKEDFLITEPLDIIQQQLSSRQFFRVNRQMLVNFNACGHFENIAHQKLRLYVIPETKEPIIVSQKKAKEFKEWMGR